MSPSLQDVSAPEEKASRWVPIGLTIIGALLAGGVAYGAATATTSARLDDHEKRITSGEAFQNKVEPVLDRLDRRTLLLACKANPQAPECVP